jgi:hypothetical protein
MFKYQTPAYAATAPWRISRYRSAAPRDLAGDNGGRRHPCDTCRAHRGGISTIGEQIAMQAIAVRDCDAGLAGLSLADLPCPHAAENGVIVRVRAAGFTRGELAWEGTWTDRGGRNRTPSVPGHEVSGVVAALGYGTTTRLSAARRRLSLDQCPAIARDMLPGSLGVREWATRAPAEP